MYEHIIIVYSILKLGSGMEIERDRDKRDGEGFLTSIV